MTSRTVTIVNRLGLHARPATEFVALARSFSSEVTIGRPDDLLFVNAKDVVSILSLDLCVGDELEIVVEGKDEACAADALARLVSSGFQVC